MFGLGLGLAILIDVLVVRLLIAPAVVTLLGDHAWWLPRWLDRILPNVSLEGHLVQGLDEPAQTADDDDRGEPRGGGLQLGLAEVAERQPQGVRRSAERHARHIGDGRRRSLRRAWPPCRRASGRVSQVKKPPAGTLQVQPAGRCSRSAFSVARQWAP